MRTKKEKYKVIIASNYDPFGYVGRELELVYKSEKSRVKDFDIITHQIKKNRGRLALINCLGSRVDKKGWFGFERFNYNLNCLDELIACCSSAKVNFFHLSSTDKYRDDSLYGLSKRVQDDLIRQEYSKKFPNIKFTVIELPPLFGIRRIQGGVKGMVEALLDGDKKEYLRLRELCEKARSLDGEQAAKEIKKIIDSIMGFTFSKNESFLNRMVMGHSVNWSIEKEPMLSLIEAEKQRRKNG